MPGFNEALKILQRCGVIKAGLSGLRQAEDAEAELQPGLRAELLDAAWDELRAIRRYLSLPSVAWRSCWHRTSAGSSCRTGGNGTGRPSTTACAPRCCWWPCAGRWSTSWSARLPAGRAGPRTIIRVAAAVTGDGRPSHGAGNPRRQRAEARAAAGDQQHAYPPLVLAVPHPVLASRLQPGLRLRGGRGGAAGRGRRRGRTARPDQPGRQQPGVHRLQPRVRDGPSLGLDRQRPRLRLPAFETRPAARPA